MRHRTLNFFMLTFLIFSINTKNVTAQTKKEKEAFKTKITSLLDTWIAIREKQNKDLFPIDGVRQLYSNEKENLGFKLMGNLIGEPVFLEGPHKKEMNFEASTFGYYNPKFLKKLENLLVDLFSDEAWVNKYREIYYTSIYQYLNRHEAGYNYFIENEEEIQEAIDSYKEGKKTWIPIELKKDNSGLDLEDNYLRQTVSFWARRSMDGTVDQFKTLLDLVRNAFENQYSSIQPFSIGIMADFENSCYGYTPLKLKKGAKADSYWISNSEHIGVLEKNTEINIETLKKQKIEVFERTIYSSALNFNSDGGFYFDGIDADALESTGNYYTEWEKLELDNNNSFRFKNEYKFWSTKEILDACPIQATATEDDIDKYFLNKLKGIEFYAAWGEKGIKNAIKERKIISKKAVQIQIRYVEKGKQKTVTCTFFVEIGTC